jgi:hypothetical protein
MIPSQRMLLDIAQASTLSNQAGGAAASIHPTMAAAMRKANGMASSHMSRVAIEQAKRYGARAEPIPVVGKLVTGDLTDGVIRRRGAVRRPVASTPSVTDRGVTLIVTALRQGFAPLPTLVAAQQTQAEQITALRADLKASEEREQARDLLERARDRRERLMVKLAVCGSVATVLSLAVAVVAIVLA